MTFIQRLQDSFYNGNVEVHGNLERYTILVREKAGYKIAYIVRSCILIKSE